MAHFAKIVDGKVERVISVSNDDCGGGDFPDSEAVGQEFIASLGLDGEWKQTSYNKNFRGQFAGAGHFYNSDLDCFHGPEPVEGCTLGSDGIWIEP